MLRIARFLDTYMLSALAYLLVASVSACVEWLSFYLLLTVDRPWRAALLAFVVATCANYALCRTFAFRTARPIRDEAILLGLASSLAFVFNFSAFLVLHSAWNVDPMPAKVVGTCVGFVANYTLRQFYIFDRVTKFRSISALAHWTRDPKFGQVSARPTSAPKNPP